MSDTVMRQWMMLRMVPRSPSKISTIEIMNNLAAESFIISQRSIQRDLDKFSSIFPLECDDRSKPFGWSWRKDAPTIDIPGMDSHTALAFYLAEQHLEPILPRETVVKLNPHFLSAKKILNELSGDSGTTSWVNKVRVLRQGPDLSTPEIDAGVQEKVYTALLLNKRLEVQYKKRGATKAKDYTISPLALVLKNGIFYIPCTVFNYDDIRLMTLHRIKQATLTDAMIDSPENFDLDAYIQSGELSFQVGDMIKLTAIIDKDVAFHLGERKLSPDQTLEEQEDDTFLLQATVNDTSELRFWLRGYDEQIEVLEPKELRDDLYRSAQAQIKKYEASQG
ncbi:helix-turn-helix transcriptional regulator [Ghiorsea bivora]|uniref:helix-turn-helix transcriptional regulator n=1 Tax=Ghiorsea bivora TaxID=1485545 RepID=UPI001E3DC3A3|nr:WYL domain-containing protein [Ghiorsea bivora]